MCPAKAETMTSARMRTVSVFLQTGNHFTVHPHKHRGSSLFQIRLRLSENVQAASAFKGN
jgi:hypothetical protein